MVVFFLFFLISLQKNVGNFVITQQNQHFCIEYEFIIQYSIIEKTGFKYEGIPTHKYKEGEKKDF